MHMINNFDPGLAYKQVRVKPTLTRTKSDPNNLDYPDDPNQLQNWNLGHWVKISLNQSKVYTCSFSANKYIISFILV